MATNLMIDPELLEHAVELGGLATKRATVELALREFVARRAAADLLAAFGTLDADPSFDAKASRSRRGHS